MFFASCVAMRLHPGNMARGGFNLEDATQIADEMFRVYLERFPCPGSSED